MFGAAAQALRSRIVAGKVDLPLEELLVGTLSVVILAVLLHCM